MTNREPLNRDELQRRLVDTNLYQQLTVLDHTGSTNADLLQAAADGAPTFTAEIAEFQDAGRGRRGRAWVTPAHSQVTFSVLVRPRTLDHLGLRLSTLCRHCSALVSPSSGRTTSSSVATRSVASSAKHKRLPPTTPRLSSVVG